VMSVNTIASSPSGARASAVPAAAADESLRDAPGLELEPEPDDVADCEGPPVEVHEPQVRARCGSPPDDDEVEDTVDVAPAESLESPCMEERRVMISRKVGRMVGSWCQQLVISSSNSGGQPDGARSGSGGRAPSLITATATAAGLHRDRKSAMNDTHAAGAHTAHTAHTIGG
jgi:hypothetical protein